MNGAMAAQVLVAGAGPVGLTLTHELLRRGVRVRLVDAAAGPAVTSRALATHARSNVNQGTEWPWGEQGVASTPEDLSACMLLGEATEERGFADASLAGQHAEAARPRDPDVLEVAFERGQLGRSLHELG